ncbi:hypothetical protein MAR_008110, partial [Mya arenaria]
NHNRLQDKPLEAVKSRRRQQISPITRMGQSSSSRYREEEQANGRGSRNRNKNMKRAKQAAKKLKKADIDGVDGEATVEAPPEGGLSGWAVCGGSAVITSATAVVRTTVHVSVDSINTAFNVTKAGNKTTGNVTTPAP